MAAGARKERRVVTVVFADLVGFTARAETLDPEGVEAILRPSHARLREELERYGGTVEKFIGDRTGPNSPWIEAASAFARRDFVGAADVYGAIGAGAPEP